MDSVLAGEASPAENATLVPVEQPAAGSSLTTTNVALADSALQAKPAEAEKLQNSLMAARMPKALDLAWW